MHHTAAPPLPPLPSVTPGLWGHHSHAPCHVSAARHNVQNGKCSAGPKWRHLHLPKLRVHLRPPPRKPPRRPSSLLTFTPGLTPSMGTNALPNTNERPPPTGKCSAGPKWRLLHLLPKLRVHFHPPPRPPPHRPPPLLLPFLPSSSLPWTPMLHHTPTIVNNSAYLHVYHELMENIVKEWMGLPSTARLSRLEPRSCQFLVNSLPNSSFLATRFIFSSRQDHLKTVSWYISSSLVLYNRNRRVHITWQDLELQVTGVNSGTDGGSQPTVALRCNIRPCWFLAKLIFRLQICHDSVK